MEYKSVEERIGMKRTLIQKISGVETRLFTISDLAGKGKACADARVNLEGFISRYGNGNEEAVPAGKRGELKTLKDKAEQTLVDFQGLRDEKERLEAELGAFRAELLTLDCSATLGDICAVQSKIGQAKQEESELAVAIEKQQAVIDGSRCEPPQSLYERRQDLLADQATGKDVSQSLQAVEKDISAKEKRIDMAIKVREDAKNTLDGLTRKIADVRKNISELESDLKEMTVFFLKTEAAKAEHDYQAMALDLAGTYKRLVALDAILCQLDGGGEKSFVSGVARNFGIPALGPNSEADMWLFKATLFGMPAMLAEEKSRLDSLGVHC
jgi:chromosome segregation ATPase